MRVTFLKKIKNVVADIFKKKGKKIEAVTENKPENEIKEEANNRFWGMKKRGCNHTTCFKSELDAKQKRKRRIKTKMQKKSRQINRAA